MMVMLLPLRVFTFPFELIVDFFFEPLNVLFGKDVDDTPQDELLKLKLVNI